MGKITVLLLLCVCIPGWSQDVIPTPAQTQQKCGDWERFALGEIVVENNVWNKKNTTDYRQCLFTETRDGKTLFGWEWKWPAGGDVWSYPEIIYGHKPWNSTSTTARLPCRVKDIAFCRVLYDVALKAEGTGNLAFDIRITREAVPAEKNIVMELMIWMDNAGQRPDGLLQGSVTIAGEAYDFFKGNPPHAGWASAAFIKKIPRHRGPADVKAFPISW